MYHSRLWDRSLENNILLAQLPQGMQALCAQQGGTSCLGHGSPRYLQGETRLWLHVFPVCSCVDTQNKVSL